ncbi:hypothetical protein [Candidatus Accumulibacter sp. ACC003]|uniref:hypothetical protein n=1 Tax=Candidatus Accumulibacter sp. ACC003 TaxID=2823334 RepID=UPI0025C45545|nr:hypothetical protein [Candidatus Accumulibacter sp. ACC003]
MIHQRHAATPTASVTEAAKQGRISNGLAHLRLFAHLNTVHNAILPKRSRTSLLIVTTAPLRKWTLS